MTAQPRFSAPQSAKACFPGDTSQNTKRPSSAAPMRRMTMAEDAAAIAKRAKAERGTAPRSKLHGDIGAPDLRANVVAGIVGPECRTAIEVRIATGFSRASVDKTLLTLVRAGRLHRSARKLYRYYQIGEVVE